MLADREIELTLLDELARAAGNRDGSLVVVSGAIGVGKTALLAGVASRAHPSAVVLDATGSIVERLFPFGVIRQLCEPVVAGLDDTERAQVDEGLTEFARPLLSGEDLFGVAVDARAPVMQQVMHGVRHLLNVYGANRQVLVFVDDVQWADLESLRCLGYLASRLAGTSVLMVVTLREGSPEGDNQGVRDLLACAGRVLRLGPLSATGIRSMVRQQFGVSGSDQFVNVCHEVSGGNPMVLRAVLDELAAVRRCPVDDSAEWVRDCRPALLRDRLVARLRAQPDSALEFLRALSCLGPGAEPEILARLAGLDELGYAEVARALSDQGFLLTDRTPAFVHPVMREAVDWLTSPTQVERLHTAAAAWLHAAGHPVEHVADHLLAVPSQQAMWAVDVLREAAEGAVRRGDVDAATRYLRRTLLDTAPDSVSRADLLLDLAAVEHTVDVSAATRHVLEAVSLSRGVAGQAAALVRLSPAALGLSSPPVLNTLNQVAAAFGESGGLPGPDRELALRLEARVLAGSQEIDSAVRRLRGADHDELLESPGGRELLGVTLELAAVSAAIPAAEVRRLGHRLLDREPATSGPHGIASMVLCALSLAESSAPVESWLDAAVGHGDPVARAAADASRTLLRAGAGRVDDDIELVAERLVTADGWFSAMSVAGMLRTVIALELYGRGRVRRETETDVAHPLTARIAQLCTDRAEHPIVAALLRAVAASRACGAGEPRQALEHVLDCGRQLDRAGWCNPALVPWRSGAALLLHQLGETDEALELVSTEHELAVGWGSAASVGRALAVRGALTSGTAGVRLLRDAVDVLAESSNELERARAHLVLGTRLADDDRGEADIHLRLGRELREEDPADRLVGYELRVVIGTTGTDDQSRKLTAAERRVVTMVVDGLTNQAIADELGVSRRAVEKHLTNVYTKLDVTGRAELKATQTADATR
ncbi:ATP-binding protein [Tamaricihabitans halophyticus]|uniref:ATP-binding protein n=1 Tax=Tamaricihabitans halophyticus TaxID=1262583 RepID=UPI0014042B17|nr:LuxR family transcriptional regulator [Tamaricihabitans halophyticus]